MAARYFIYIYNILSHSVCVLRHDKELHLTLCCFVQNGVLIHALGSVALL